MGAWVVAAVTIGVLVEPLAGPAHLAGQLARDLPGHLSRRLAEERRDWRVDVRRERLPPGDEYHTELTERAGGRVRQYGWELAVCLTDQPLRTGKQPIVADLNRDRRVIVVSLPAFGAMNLRRRVREVVVQLVADLRAPGGEGPGTTGQQRLPPFLARFRRESPQEAGIDIRILASRGGMRLLVGLIKANRPWRLVFGMTGPLVGAFAFSVFYLINSTAWELATSMDPLRLVAVALGSVAAMVAWLILYHRLWEPLSGRSGALREQTMLSNASMVVTVATGVGLMYAGLYVVNLAAALVVLPPQVFGRYVGADPGFGDYATAVVLVTAAATVAGAIGSGFESQESVREATFSRRERERREARDREQAARERRDD